MLKWIGIVGRLLREVFWIAVAVGIVAGGVFGFRYLGENKEVVAAEQTPRLKELVDTVVLSEIDGPLPIRGEGFVQPNRQLSLSSKVAGRVVEMHPAIDSRGRFLKGDVLVRLEDETERATLQQNRANLKATETQLRQANADLERAQTLLDRGVISSTEVDNQQNSVEQLEANLDALRAAIEIAEISLDQRKIVAPFDGAVLEKAVEVGDVISAGQQLAEIFSEGQLEIDIAVRQADAALIPGLFEGSPAMATAEISFAGYSFEWDGVVSRVEPRLDSVTRTLTVTVALSDLKDGGDAPRIASGAPPALINAFAHVVIDGVQPEATYRIPSTALRSGSDLWLLEDGRLAVETAALVHVDGEFSYVSSDAALEGRNLIVSSVSAPVPGVELEQASPVETAALSEPAQ